jgi:hypothetical protein
LAMILRVKKVSKPVKRAPRRRKRKLTRAEQIEEAAAILLSLLTRREFALDRITRIANRFENKTEAQAVFRDLLYITLTLTSVERFGPIEMWRRYHHHFANHDQRNAFFSRLLPLTRCIASARLYGKASRRAELWAQYEASNVRWDSSLLPADSEPYVVHLATLYPGVLEEFLPRLFVQMRESIDPSSTFVRALEILRAVPELGWADYKHTENLIKLKFLKPSQIGAKQMVKKFIRDLRQRYPKDP